MVRTDRRAGGRSSRWGLLQIKNEEELKWEPAHGTKGFESRGGWIDVGELAGSEKSCRRAGQVGDATKIHKRYV